MSLFAKTLVIIKGGGDLASGVAYRLKRAGFPLIITELRTPLFVRRTVSYGAAVYDREIALEGIVARRVDSFSDARTLAHSADIPVLVDPPTDSVRQLKPGVVVDAIVAKRNTGTSMTDAPLVVALGPGFAAGSDCHAVIETNRGHALGRVIYSGQAEPDTQSPGAVKGYTVDRVLRAPAAGHVEPVASIGMCVKQGALIALVNDKAVRAPFDGVLRGLVHPSVPVTEGFKIGDLDPRGNVAHCFTISDKSLAIGGGVLEAILASDVIHS